MKINNILMTVASCAALLGCTAKFEEFNTNQHEATYEQVLPGLAGGLFQQMERNVVLYRDGTGPLDSDYQIMYNVCAEAWAGYLTPILGNGNHNGSFNINDGWSRSMWVNKFSYTMNAYNSLQNVVSKDEQPDIYALADIVKVASMHQVTDYYGPMPYSQAGKSLTPDYDSQEAIYNQMLSELDDAIEVLKGFTATKVLSDYDLVYGGDVTKWIKFANSLRLRLAMRVVYADEALAKEEAEKSLTDPFGLIDTNADNAVVSGVPHHPIYEISVNFNDGDTQMGASMECYLNGYTDPRLPFMWKTAKDGKYHGVRLGVHSSNWTNYRNSAGLASAPNAENYDIIWINAAEVNFLRAEAALRGWNAGGTAQAFYEEGIKQSFEQWGATNLYAHLAKTSQPTTYSQNFGNNSGSSSVNTRPSTIRIPWNTSGTAFEENLERIIVQKWIAIYPNGCEAWAEYRRTHYPALLTATNNDSNGICENTTSRQIARVPFPISEQAENASGLAVGISHLGGPDNAGTRLWWDCKN